MRPVGAVIRRVPAVGWIRYRVEVSDVGINPRDHALTGLCSDGLRDALLFHGARDLANSMMEPGLALLVRAGSARHMGDHTLQARAPYGGGVMVMLRPSGHGGYERVYLPSELEVGDQRLGVVRIVASLGPDFLWDLGVPTPEAAQNLRFRVSVSRARDPEAFTHADARRGLGVPPGYLLMPRRELLRLEAEGSLKWGDLLKWEVGL